jgi:AbrB family looped-hinge helix DNA binding protein
MFDHSDLYFTTVTVGKKGQIIIPAKLRKELSIAPEEQLVILSGPHQEGFAVLKTKSFIERQEKFKKLTEQIFGRNMDSVKSVKTGKK